MGDSFSNLPPREDNSTQVKHMYYYMRVRFLFQRNEYKYTVFHGKLKAVALYRATAPLLCEWFKKRLFY